MSKPPYYKTLSGPQIFVWRMVLFVALVGLIAWIFNQKILELVNFNSSMPLKLLIICVLFFGIMLTFQQVLRLYPEVRWVNNFRISDPGLANDHVPVMLAPMAMMLRRRQGQAAISATASRSILDSIGSRLDETRETTRYLVGLLIFLGLIGTFWGLLITTGSVGETIQALNTEGKDTATGLPGAEDEPRSAAGRHGHRVFRLAPGLCRLLDPGLPRHSGRPGAIALL